MNENDIKENNIALFIDLENLIRSAVDIALPIDLAPIINRMLEHGRLSIRRGYGDLDAACRSDWQLRSRIRHMLHENLIQVEDIPYVTRNKNAADMRLTVEALSVAYTSPNITSFAIVASDRDYVPLIAKLKELGRYIIGVGISPDTVNEIYIKSCDVFFYYSNLFPSANSPIADVSAESEVNLLDDYIKLLCQAISSVNLKGGNPLGASISILMRQLRPDFDLTLVKLGGFRDLVKVAEDRGVVKSYTPPGGDMLLYLAGNASDVLNLPQKFQIMATIDPEKLKTMYRNFFEDKMKCPLPALSYRKRIYKHLVKKVEANAFGTGPADLNSLSGEIARDLGNEGFPIIQAAVFKVLYALFRAYAFDAILGDQPYNPRIKSVKYTVEELDMLFIRNCLLVLRRERRSWQMHEEILGNIFETPAESIKNLVASSGEY
jgi:uncharacterized LabA/DUF88 family protein